jgi:parallel beta-helix repeat protein
LSDCVIKSNYGTSAIEASDECLITGCNISGNSGIGIEAGTGCTFLSCLIEANNSNGILAEDKTSLINCTVSNNNCPYGVVTGDDSAVDRCSVIANTGFTPLSGGVKSGNNCVVKNCVVSKNSNTNSPSTNTQGFGIQTGVKSVVENCQVTFNTGDGIRVSHGSEVRNCTCIENGIRGDQNRNGAGILLLEYDCVVENNTVRYNDYGIKADGVRNLIIKNRARNNGVNYEIADQNRLGVIVFVPVSGPVSGSTGGTGVGTTDPWANFSY